ncbi:hypothetical protein BR93DRAFT_727378 [Coniochaeta sp. PMI_546]|nr:hypothetical protein BR93DRAFT_727378 [Coniochaeta sp. PMI_546]
MYAQGIPQVPIPMNASTSISRGKKKRREAILANRWYLPFPTPRVMQPGISKETMPSP